MGLLNPEKRWHIYIIIYHIHNPPSVCWSQLHRITALGMWLEIPWIETSLDTETRSMIQNSFIEYIFFSLCWQLPRDDTAQIKRKSDGFLWCIPRTVSNRTKLSSTRPLQLRHTSQLLLLLGTFLVDGRLPKLTLHGDGVGALECPRWNGWPEAQLHHASKQFRI